MTVRPSSLPPGVLTPTAEAEHPSAAGRRRRERDLRDQLTRQDPRRARHWARTALNQVSADLDDIPEPVDGRSMRSRHRRRTVNHAKGKLERTGRGGSKVWKATFWKRRKLHRRQRALAEQALADAE